MFKYIFSVSMILGSVLVARESSLVSTEYVSTEIEDKELAEFFANMTEDEAEQTIAFFSLDWKEPGTYKLSNSKSTLSLPEGYKILLGEEANKAMVIAKEPIRQYMEAVVYDDAFENTVIFESFKNGYVSLDDWKDLNPKELLECISKRTEEANKERQKNGGIGIHVVGWIQEPTLDRHTNTVYWAIEAENDDDSENIVNSVALRLGREGFEKLTWVTERSYYSPFGGNLDVMLRAHSFDPGHRYSDYTAGDKIAGYGVASLVAATVGAKVIKAGGLVVLLKKIGGFLVAGVAAVLYKIKNIFRRKKRGDDSNG